MTDDPHAAAPISAPDDRPGSWLHELLRVRRAPWSWPHATRSALCIALPWGIGVATDESLLAMWVSLGAMMASAAEPPRGPYAAMLRQIAIAACIGALGAAVGMLLALPWAVTVAAMTAAGLAAGIVSRWGAAFSLGAMQFMLVAAITAGLAKSPSFWPPALIYLGGAAIYAAALAVEVVVFRRRRVRGLVAALAGALSALAASRVADAAAGRIGAPPETRARRAATDALAALEAEASAAMAAAAGTLFARILAETDPAALRTAAARLAAMAEPARRGRSPPPASADTTRLAAALGAFLATGDVAGAATTGDAATQTGPDPSVEARSDGRAAGRALHGLMPDRAVLHNAAALALCLALAYSIRWIRGGEHWFWVPLTVGLVMKPDLGSVFARAVLRASGTIAGAAIGVAVLTMLPKGIGQVAAVALFASFLPWATRASYAVHALALTPLVLMLVGVHEPGPFDADYAVQRVVDTCIGSAIVLVFGYFLWRRTDAPEAEARFRAAAAAVADYAMAVADPGAGVEDRRRAAYGRLAALRAGLRSHLAEPPPASRRAAAWLALVSAEERICDRIAALSASATELSAADAAAIRAVAGRIAMTTAARSGASLPPDIGQAATAAAFVDGVEAELRSIDADRTRACPG